MDIILEQIRPHYLKAREAWVVRKREADRLIKEANINFDLQLTEGDLSSEGSIEPFDKEYHRLEHIAHITFMNEIGAVLGFGADDDGICYVMDRFLCEGCWEDYSKEYDNINTFDECANKVLQEHIDYNNKE